MGYIVHRVTKSWTQLKWLSTHAHTLENMGKSTLGNLPKITNKPNIHAKTNANVHNRQKGNQKCINWQVNTKQNMLYLYKNRTKRILYTTDGLQNLGWNHKTPESYVRRAYAPRFLSRHNKDLEWWTLKPPRRVTALGSWTDRVIVLRSRIDCVIALRSRMDHIIALRQLSVTAQCYSSILFRR